MNSNAWLLISTVLIFCGCAANIDSSVANTPIAHVAVKLVALSATLCLGFGAVCIISGIILIVMGCTGSINLSIELAGISAELVNAA